MGGKGVRSRSDAYKMRQKMRYMSMKRLMEEKANQERNPPTRDIVSCQKCGFKARYKFHRCPHCDEVQK